MKYCSRQETAPEQQTAFIHQVTLDLVDSYQDGIGVNHSEGNNLPREDEVLNILSKHSASRSAKSSRRSTLNCAMCWSAH